MKSALVALLVIAGVVFLILLANPLLEGLHDFRTDNQSDAFSVNTTGSGSITTGNVTLTQALFQSGVQHVTSISSNWSADVPLATAYNSNTRILTVSGLVANQTRTLNITYDRGVLDGNIDQVANTTPTIWIFSIVGLLLLAIAGAVIAVMRG